MKSSKAHVHSYRPHPFSKTQPKPTRPFLNPTYLPFKPLAFFTRAFATIPRLTTFRLSPLIFRATLLFQRLTRLKLFL